MAKADPFRFSTKYQDDETDLFYYGYRYYSANTGRWLSRDPIGVRGGKNLYALLSDDAVNRRDYLGLLTWDPPLLKTLPDHVPDPKGGDIYGATAWYYVRPRAYAYPASSSCSCGQFKVSAPGNVQVSSWWVAGDEEARKQELTHVYQHFRRAYDSYKENAESMQSTCRSKGNAECSANVINSEMRTAYMFQALATAKEWDCSEYGSEPGSTACQEARTAASNYANALKALQAALDACEKQ